MDATVTHTLLILATECIVVLLGICVTVVVMMLRKSSGDKQAATSLVNKLKKNEPHREETLREIFASNYHLEGEELDARVNEFSKREKAFYKMLIATYMRHDGKQFPKLSEALEGLIAPCIELTPEGLIDAGELETANADLDTLKEENSELTAELQANKDIVKELLKEYSAAFEKGADTDKPLPDDVAQPRDPGDTDTAAETTAGEPVDPAVADEELDLDNLFSQQAAASTPAVEEGTEATAVDDTAATPATETDTGIDPGNTGTPDQDAASQQELRASEEDIARDVDEAPAPNSSDVQEPDTGDVASENAPNASDEAPVAEPAAAAAATTGNTETETDTETPISVTDEAIETTDTDKTLDIDIDSLFDEAQEGAQTEAEKSPGEDVPKVEENTRDPALDFDLSEQEPATDNK